MTILRRRATSLCGLVSPLSLRRNCMSQTDLVRVLLLAVLGQDGKCADTERQKSTEQPHG